MANIAASDLTYAFSIRDKKCIGSAGYSARGTIAFGNNTLTYGTGGGIPLTKGKMGLPRFIRSFIVIGSSSDAYEFSYIPSTEKLQLMVLGSFTPVGTVAAPTISLGNNAGNVVANATIGLSALANASALVGSGGPWVGITGVQAPLFTGTANANVVLGELTNVAIVTTTIHVEVEGY